MHTPILSAATSDAHFSVIGMFLFFFFAFALAALIWWLLWMLVGDEGGKSEETNRSEAPEPELEPVVQPESQPVPVAESEATVESDLPNIVVASEAEAAEQFSEELAEGKVRQDPVYGIVYQEAPETVDDLKKIKGVAKVLEGKLNGVGVYRFKQVAVWTDAACQEFSKMLTFKDRIYRDDWIAQAKEFHHEKYDEKL